MTRGISDRQVAQSPHRYYTCTTCGVNKYRSAPEVQQVRDGAIPSGPRQCRPCRKKTEKTNQRAIERQPEWYYECGDCGAIKQLSKRGQAKPEFCLACRRKPENWDHGKYTTYASRKCRCAPCTEAQARMDKAWRQSNAARFTYVCQREECGQEFSTIEKDQRFCGGSCGAKAGMQRYSRSLRAPVLYDPEFAAVQEQRVVAGFHFVPDALGWWIDSDRRHALYELHGWTCQECGALCSRKHVDDGLPTITLDHLLPRSRWPENHPLMHDDFNLTVLCQPCNSRKFNHVTNKAWIPYLVLSGDLSVNKARQLRREMIKKSPQRGGTHWTYMNQQQE